MQSPTREVDVDKILQVAESLENIVCRCFGPDGGQVLFIKSTGDLLITKDGRRILECLLLDHPIARMIVNSASRHYSITGDGVKSFVLLLCAVLRGLQNTADKTEDMCLSGNSQYQRQGYTLRRISNMLLTFQSQVLDFVMGRYLHPHFLSVYSNINEDIVLCRASIQQILDAYFCGRIASNNQVFISRLACDYLYSCLLSIDSILHVVRFVNKWFTELHIEVPGLPVDNSRILPGLIFQRPFSVYCPAEGGLRAAIVTEQIHQSLSACDIGFLVSSNIQLQLSQQYLMERTEHIMKQLHYNQIKVIFSSVKQQEIIPFYAKQYGISLVDCVTPEEIDLLCTVTGVSPLSSPFSDVLLTDTFVAASCTPLVIGGNKYIHLVLSDSLNFKSHSLVISGPVKGLSEQLVSSSQGAFKMLEQLFQPQNASWEQATDNPRICLPNRSVLAQEQRVTFSKSQNYSACCECRLLGSSPSHISCTRKEEGVLDDAVGECIASTSAPRCMGTSNMCLNQATNQAKGPQTRKLVAERTKSSANTATQFISLQNVGLVLPSGGVFEMLLQYHLQNFAKTCENKELAVISAMFGNALLCIPRCIYKAKKKNVCFPLVHSQFTDTLKAYNVIDRTQPGFESVSCKYQLVASVLHCINKLVNINLIVGIQIEPNLTESEETDDDDDI